MPHDMDEHDDVAIYIQPPEVTVATWSQKGQESLKQTVNNNNATRHFSDFTALHSPSWTYIMADNKKQERDFTVEVDALLSEVEPLAKVNFRCTLKAQR